MCDPGVSIVLRDQLPELVIGQVPDIPLASNTKEFMDLVQSNDDRHVFVESFRNLRSSLLFMFEEARRPKSAAEAARTSPVRPRWGVRGKGERAATTSSRASSPNPADPNSCN